MNSKKRSVCELGFLRNCAVYCVVVVVVLLLYNDPFLILWWPQRPAERSKTVVLPLDLATDSIDDMYDGCRSETASLIDLFGVFEWSFNRNFSNAWAFVEKYAKKPAHKHIQKDHAIVVFMFTYLAFIRQDFNEAVKTGKNKYNTDRFRFHYFYFYLTDAIQALRHDQMSCRTTYYRSQYQFEQNLISAYMRFGSFTWTTSSKQTFGFNGNTSCFEIYTCFGADISYYSSINQKGQVLIPTYEVFKITDVLTSDPWCSVVYKLQSTKIPRTNQNCKLSQSLTKTNFLPGLTDCVVMSVYAVLLMIISVILLKHKERCFVTAVLGALLVLIVIVLMLS
ncbi:ecto-ADP-ribosyltransferase 4-like [Melanotaenia boesemani]|uniref:ecto-ADP-ribosyltransferase 4-like n=1 Tax=Melanotaenia boesemani TaxID=1250792 RepID=UPI001C03FC2D|nr:ecto-ADP-ribosyltransferase 4-like [Melanotaenia boesemani]XP_041837822.1 ecto-ADP-ribosyltransferase 4-like [Melanotaenia boesemani]